MQTLKCIAFDFKICVAVVVFLHYNLVYSLDSITDTIFSKLPLLYVHLNETSENLFWEAMPCRELGYPCGLVFFPHPPTYTSPHPTYTSPQPNVPTHLYT